MIKITISKEFDYYSLFLGGKRIPVSGRRIFYPGFDDRFVFFVHDYLGSESGYTVSEHISGMNISQEMPFPSPKEAVAYAWRLLCEKAETPENLERLIKEKQSGPPKKI